jgi:hypothetical protein
MYWYTEIANKIKWIIDDLDKYLANHITDAENKDPRNEIIRSIERLNERIERIKEKQQK